MNANTKLCWECGTYKPTSQFLQLGRVGRSNRNDQKCSSCRRPDEPIGPTPQLTRKKPYRSQLDRITRISELFYGSPSAAFERHGHPATRGEAANLLRLIEEERDEADRSAAKAHRAKYRKQKAGI